MWIKTSTYLVTKNEVFYMSSKDTQERNTAGKNKFCFVVFFSYTGYKLN